MNNHLLQLYLKWSNILKDNNSKSLPEFFNKKENLEDRLRQQQNNFQSIYDIVENLEALFMIAIGTIAISIPFALANLIWNFVTFKTIGISILFVTVISFFLLFSTHKNNLNKSIEQDSIAKGKLQDLFFEDIQNHQTMSFIIYELQEYCKKFKSLDELSHLKLNILKQNFEKNDIILIYSFLEYYCSYHISDKEILNLISMKENELKELKETPENINFFIANSK